MTPYESGDTSAEGREGRADPRVRRRKAIQYAVPVAVVGVAAATIGLVPALADSGDPDLPKISAQELVEKIAKSDTEQLSGTVKINTDLGLPDLGGMASRMAPGAAGGNGPGATADPESKLTELASGTHTLRVAVDGPQKQRLSILDDAAEYSVIHNGTSVWAYDSASNQAVHSTHPASQERHAKKDLPNGAPATPQEFARQALKATDGTTSVKVDGTAQVAGHDAYRLVIKPRQSGSTVGAITIAVDAKTGSPLKFTLTPASGGAAVIDVGYTKVDFAKPAASTFDFTPPKGTKVTQGPGYKKNQPKADGSGRAGEKLKGLGGLEGLNVIGKGWNSVAEFTLPGGQGMPSAKSDGVPPDAQRFLDSLGDKASGKFGSGTVFSTRLINALVTDDGKVYVGAVDKAALVKAANAAK